MKSELGPQQVDDVREFQEENRETFSSNSGCGCSQCNSSGPHSCREAEKETEK